jgi:hypothetical protein
MRDLDSKLYEALQRCASADLPISFCGESDTQKWELLSMLRRQIAEAESRAHEQALQGQ